MLWPSAQRRHCALRQHASFPTIGCLLVATDGPTPRAVGGRFFTSETSAFACREIRTNNVIWRPPGLAWSACLTAKPYPTLRFYSPSLDAFARDYWRGRTIGHADLESVWPVSRISRAAESTSRMEAKFRRRRDLDRGNSLGMAASSPGFEQQHEELLFSPRAQWS